MGALLESVASQGGVWADSLPMHRGRQASRTQHPFPARRLLPSPCLLLMLPFSFLFLSLPVSSSLTSFVTTAPWCRWEGTSSPGNAHCFCVCLQSMRAMSFIEDGTVSPSFFVLAVGSQPLKLNNFSPFTNGTKQAPLKIHGTQTCLVGNHACTKSPKLKGIC